MDTTIHVVSNKVAGRGAFDNWNWGEFGVSVGVGAALGGVGSIGAVAKGVGTVGKAIGKGAKVVSKGVGKIAGKAGSKAIGWTGKIGEKALSKLGGTPNHFFRTSRGARFVDRFVGGVAHESKVGRTSLTKFVKTQIAKDAELVGRGKIDRAIWHFYRSPVTGKIGPTGNLSEALKKASIDLIVHH